MKILVDLLSQMLLEACGILLMEFLVEGTGKENAQSSFNLRKLVLNILRLSEVEKMVFLLKKLRLASQAITACFR